MVFDSQNASYNLSLFPYHPVYLQWKIYRILAGLPSYITHQLQPRFLQHLATLICLQPSVRWPN